jgi:HlyD family secretion protein
MNALFRSTLALLLLIVWVGCQQSNKTLQPVQKNLMEAVYASGFVVSEQEYQVFSLADGIIAEIRAKEGTRVKKGDVLFGIESTQQAARYAMAKEAYQQARQNAGPVLRELEAAFASAQTKMQFDSVNFMRFQNLLKSGATTRLEYDKAEIQYKGSRNDFIAIKNRLTKTRNEVELAISNAYNQLKIAEEESGHYLIRSEIDGMVFKVMKEKGELVRRSEAIAVVGRPNRYLLKLTIDELDVQRVKEGQDVMVKIDAYPNQFFNGKVSKVYPLVDTRQQSLRIDAQLLDTLPGLFSGLAVEANIIIRQKKDALVIPRLALLPGDSVWVETEGKEKKIKVVRGIETLDEVEIQEGLTPNSNIVLK